MPNEKGVYLSEASLFIVHNLFLNSLRIDRLGLTKYCLFPILSKHVQPKFILWITIFFFGESISGFVKLKNSQNPRKTGRGWVGQAPIRIFFNFVFCCVFLCFHVSKKK